MTGLEKIVAEICNEAAAEAKQTVDKATAEAGAIMAEAQKDADGTADKIAAQTAADVAEIERSRASAIALQKRQRTLEQKQQLLAETLQKAQHSLYQLDDVAYFGLLVKLAAGAAEAGEGQLLMNEKDSKRAPKDFEKQVAGALPAGASLKLSAESRPINGGFVLKYGDIEQNCSFEAIFAARADEFSDLVRGTLFG